MLRQSLFRAALRCANPLFFASPSTFLLLGPPKNVSLLRSPLLPHSIRAYRPLRRSPKVDSQNLESEEEIQAKYEEHITPLFNMDPDGKRYRNLLLIFTILAVPVTICFQFPSRSLPPMPDPPELRHLSHTPLTPKMWLTSPLISLRLFSYRLRRGEYVETIRRNFTFSTLNYMGIDREGNPERWRWWTWGTYMFAHGSILHLGGCYIAMSSILHLMTLRFGVIHTLGLFTAGGVGAAAVTCIFGSIRYGHEIRDGTGTQIDIKRLIVINSYGEMVEKDVRLLRPVPGLEGVFATNVGSSGGLMAMLTVLAIAMPQTNWSPLFIPVGIPARTVLGALVAWDVAGAVGLLPPMGIAHAGHLGGDIMGLLAYFFVFRRLPIGKLLKYLRNQQGFR
ncbi:hypothetical protein BDD12DRAFT_833470 [Trichophaea hybrida]|nr:hypothetical protein BDD12DRAFT_833470 [Trichophaea hybrida]